MITMLYLQVIEQMRRALGNSIRLSIVMPFGSATNNAQWRGSGVSSMNRVDEVAVMSYRTDLEELEECCRNPFYDTGMR